MQIIQKPSFLPLFAAESFLFVNSYHLKLYPIILYLKTVPIGGVSDFVSKSTAFYFADTVCYNSFRGERFSGLVRISAPDTALLHALTFAERYSLCQNDKCR